VKAADVALIPQGITFEDLELRVDQDLGQVLFETDVLAQVARKNNLEWSALLEDTDQLTALLLGWYQTHREAGGAMNLAAEQIEIYLDALHQHASHAVHLSPSTVH
jgi:hypothetical protein